MTPTLTLVTDRTRTAGRPLLEVVAAAVRGGVDRVVLRERDLDESGYRALLADLLETVGGAVEVVLGDRVALARAYALPLHLPAGASAPPPGVELASVSAHDEAEVRRAAALGAAAVVAGTAFPTRSKPGSATLGAPGIARLVEAAAGVPVVAIGGIDAANARAALAAGAAGVAVVSAILGADDPEAEARAIVRAALDSRAGR